MSTSTLSPGATIREDMNFRSHLEDAGASSKNSQVRSQSVTTTELLDATLGFAGVRPVVFDRQHALSRLGDMEDLLAVVLELIRVECPPMHHQLHASLKQRAPVELKRAAHTLKGSMSLVGAADLCARLKRVEELAGTHDFDNASRELPEIDRQFEELQRRVAAELNAE